MPYLPGKGDEKPYRKQVPTRYHNRRWKAASVAYRKEHFFCEIWLYFGRHIKCDVVDHIISINKDGAFWDRENWMPMSHFWHHRKTAMEARLKLKRKKTRGGYVPKDREEIKRIIFEKYRKEIEGLYGDAY